MRTVFAVDTYGERDPVTHANKLIIKVVRSPIVIQNGGSRDFNYDASGLPPYGQDAAVKTRGQHLRVALNQHPGVAAVLQHLDGTTLEEVKPIYVVLNDASAELISWETLWGGADDGSFVALDSRWPIGRMADPSSSQHRRPGQMELPVRIMLAISAFDVDDQANEWKSFSASLMKARKHGVPFEVSVLVGDDEIKQSIEKQIKDEGINGVSVALLPCSENRLLETVLDFDPHVLHFFCHGRADVSSQSLEMAHAGDYADDQAVRGSVNLEKKHLQYLATNLSNSWLLVINSCSGGKAVGSLNSLASASVEAGFPAAVAMLEPVDPLDAYEFTSAFYGALFKLIVKAKQEVEATGRADFEWGRAMVNARMAIRDQHVPEETRREWSLPALYVRGIDPFYFLQAAETSEDVKLQENGFRLRAKVVSDWLETAGSQQTPADRAQVVAEVMAGVPKKYWPVVEGAPNDGQ